MSAISKKSKRKTSKDSRKRIGSQELAYGRTLFDELDGQTTDHAGLVHAHVSHFQPAGNVKDSRTNDISGQNGYDSSKHAGQQSFSESKSVPSAGELIQRK